MPEIKEALARAYGKIGWLFLAIIGGGLLSPGFKYLWGAVLFFVGALFLVGVEFVAVLRENNEAGGRHRIIHNYHEERQKVLGRKPRLIIAILVGLLAALVMYNATSLNSFLHRKIFSPTPDALPGLAGPPPILPTYDPHRQGEFWTDGGTVRTSAPEKWHPLTDAQMAQWVAALKPLRPRELHVLWASSADADDLYKSFQQIGAKLSWKVEREAGWNTSDGILLSTPPNDPMRPLILGLLNSSNLHAYVDDSQDIGNQYDAIFIYIGRPEW